MSLSTSELAQLRTDAESFMAQTCTIKRVTNTDDDAGGWTESLSTVASGVACRLSPMAMGDVGIRRALITSFTEYTLTVPYDQDIEPQDRVTVGSEEYVVEAVLDEHQWKTAKRCKLSRVE